MKKRFLIPLITSVIGIIVFFFLALGLGKYHIVFPNIFKALFTSDSTYDIERSIIINLRLPRTIVALLSGMALSVSGLLYQETFRNKLVSPDLLGVSSGAGVGAALAIVLGLSATMISLFSFVAGLASVFLSLTLSKVFKSKSSTMLLLAGIIIGGLMSSGLSLIKYCADSEATLSKITYWLMGSFEDSTMKDVYFLLPVVVVCTFVLIMISWRINIVALGKEEAQTKGINYTFYRTLIIVIATLLTATTVAFSGTIGWVGLVIPHIARLLVGRNTRKTIPLSIAFGGWFMIVVDILSRTFTASEIPVSAITGLFGTIVFVIILYINRRSVTTND